MFLDTNVLIWFVQGHPRLRAPLRAAIADPSVPVCVSTATFWEMTIKHRKGKLALPAPFAEAPLDTFEAWCERAVIDILPIAPRHIERAMRLAYENEDPFDRLIAATALVENEELVSADRSFAAIAGLRLLAV